MLDPGSDAGFPVAHCARCARDVLTHFAMDGRGAARRACIHCDAEIDPEELRWVPETALDGLGYAVRGEGCGRPGCGGGRCQRE